MNIDTFGRELGRVLREDPTPDLVTDRVAVQHVDDVAVVTLSKPEARNALSLAGWRRLFTVFTELQGRAGLRAVVVRGAGPDALAAGADITEFPRTRFGAAAATDYNESIARALRAVAAVPVPVIASIHGLAVGGGCELAAACDVRIASTAARFGIPIGKLGVTLGYTETSAVARLIGPAELKYLLFSGEIVTAAEAHRIGLAQRVVEPDELVDTVTALVSRIRAQAPVTIGAAKVVTDMAGRPLTDSDADLLSRLHIAAYDGPDLREGVAAFSERRAPVFHRKRED
ncbi:MULTISPECIES: enoyl-CoA hydratase/isomerase family protein [Pseudonocardia]|uniref:Enoyl-CoA hydratase n=2 Tax=Pseudonocardia TaxID=1847 RepID=A0ABQ0S108_9PSEU|nr:MULTISPECIES: enoyl-CoA hydratase-related protein [Pseudonocardia]OSY36280.1 putative enoyl-CoA hydratase echA8 [Pseudonocardia autotrophica]TDN73085.1 short chain enoyl-CoA hydratase [Pseudonocardia autotrophica]BBG03805.1 enoyl-CoA hydratase [Pseudonocardia autotrophica]GEC26587.1 enoyl-CoA hydratase [Pseudonocardia saturnea]